ncbi:MAG: homoserine kinase, partial [Gaiellales bacterium]|nr:homoserine kinase [Gaiellales bacterium]
MSVPASSANLGPGYDCLAVALPLRNTLEVERRPGPLEVSVSGAGAETLPADATNLVVRSFAQVWQGPLDGLAFTMHNEVPLQAGTGSS